MDPFKAGVGHEKAARLEGRIFRQLPRLFACLAVALELPKGQAGRYLRHKARTELARDAGQIPAEFAQVHERRARAGPFVRVVEGRAAFLVEVQVVGFLAKGEGAFVLAGGLIAEKIPL